MLQYTDLTGVRKIDIHDEAPDTITSILQRTTSEGHWQGELCYKRLDGSTFPAMLSAFAIRDEQGTVQALGGIVRDLTEQKRYEENLHRMVAVIETSSDFIGIASPDGYPIYLNQAGQHLVGLTGEGEYQQTQVIEYFTPAEQERIQHDVMPMLMRDGRWKGECLFRHFKTGEIIEVEWNVFIINHHETGQPIAIATVTRDLREQKRVEVERTRLQQQIIDAQRAALRELSSPLIPITDQMLIMPLIGTIDSQRAQQIMEALLDGVARHHANAVIIDITGVQVVDTQVANALIQAAQAVRLLGAHVILTGIGPAMAQTLVGLGIDLSEITTLATLQTGINHVIRHH
jgi:rsbT co-antagonist protein RsbR